MNRRQRRAHRPPDWLTKLVACPDCDSDITLGECGHIEVRHDDTCPWYTALHTARDRFGHTPPDTPHEGTPA